MVASKYATKQAISEVTEQKGSETKYSNGVVIKSILKPTAKSKVEDMCELTHFRIEYRQEGLAT